ncbi:hypothetical protein L873DRAFT_360229 [Choiromyces venosus 120613-1]|uniref:C2H2-type domain-containing protein n=1 Tax=Choiromyces venosus 120613-1 TaxID=1336337 RepID=A0A3N4IYK7_9PEZI|nr:hypothetical protein L873DRAFT_360229 [Choiromyces venosus 120613-1]
MWNVVAIGLSKRAWQRVRSKESKTFGGGGAGFTMTYSASVSTALLTSLSSSQVLWRSNCTLVYRLTHSRSIKNKRRIHRSTVQSYYKTLQMVYLLDTQVALPRLTNDVVNQYIMGHLTNRYDLIMENKDKPTCSVTDLFNLLHFHSYQDVNSRCHGRNRIQLPFLMQLIAYTSTRPGSIIEANCYKGRAQVLKYKDMSLSLLRNHLEGGNILVLEVTTTFLKGKRNKREPVTYILYERRDHPIFCPIMNFLALAFADNAFMEGGIRKPEDLYSLEIPSFKEALSIQWKTEIRETPIFRRQIGDRICADTPLGFADLSYSLKRLGLLSGYPQLVTSCVLRRGAAAAVDRQEITEVQRNQIMGHARADVFRRHYLSQRVKVDTQSGYLGAVSRDDIIKNIGLMSAKRDPRAPTKLDPGDDFLQECPALTRLTHNRDQLVTSLRSKYGTLTSAKNSEPYLYDEYIRLRKQICARKKALTRAKLEKTRKEWFERVDSKEIKQQLGGELPSTFTYPTPHFNCPLRSRIAQYFNCPEDASWADTVQALSHLCLQKPPTHTKNGMGENYCPFCFGDKDLQPQDRFHSFFTTGTLRQHIHRKHAAPTTSVTPVACPFECPLQLDNGEHLKCHLAIEHELRLYN